VCEIDIPLTTPRGASVWVSLRVEPVLDASGEASEFVAVARDITEEKRAETGANITEIDLSELAMQAARLHRGALHRMTSFDFSLAEELPLVLADASLIRGLVERAICRAADSTRDGWGTISITTGLLGNPEGPLYRGCLRSGLPHDQYAFIEIHDTGSAPRKGWHQVVEEPFLSGHHSGSAMRISRAKLLVHNQGGEIELQSTTWDGTAVVILLPYCGGYGLGGF
jgi:signal transduction histidine kinase